MGPKTIPAEAELARAVGEAGDGEEQERGQERFLVARHGVDGLEVELKDPDAILKIAAEIDAVASLAGGVDSSGFAGGHASIFQVRSTNGNHLPRRNAFDAEKSFSPRNAKIPGIRLSYQKRSTPDSAPRPASAQKIQSPAKLWRERHSCTLFAGDI